MGSVATEKGAVVEAARLDCLVDLCKTARCLWRWCVVIVAKE